MFPRFFAFVLLLAGWPSVLAAYEGKPVRVFVLSGQSNMLGSGQVNQAPEAWKPLAGVLFDETRPGSSPSSESADWEEIGTAVAGMGPEMAFAATLRDAFPDETIAIIKVSQAATGLSYWSTPGQAGHDTLLARMAVIRDRLDAAVLAAEIPAWSFGGFIWMQGENEANSTEVVAQAYATNFAGLAQTIRNATATPDLPVVLGRVSIQLDPALGGPVKQPQLDQVRAGQMNWAEGDGRAAWVNTDDLTLVDAWHFGSIGQLALGQRFAAAWLGIADTRPLAFLHRADSQPANSRAQTLLYELSFSNPVLGLTAEDFVILGDTGADRVEIEELPPMDGTRWQVVVSGMTRPGVVTLQLPAGAASAVADGALNVAAFGEETSIVWTLHRGVEDLLLYDPLTPGPRPLHGLQTGAGWSGLGWNIQAAQAGFTSSTAAPLSYPKLLTTPAHTTGGGGYHASARPLDLDKTFAPFMTSRGSGSVDQPGTVLWMSYLIRPQNTTAQRVGLLRGTGPGYTENAVNVYRSGSTWRLLMLATETDTGVTATLHEDHLIALRVAIGGASSPSTTHVWINPPPAVLGGTDPDPASAAASLSETSANFKFSRVHWYPGNANNDGLLDEIRIGTTFASVTPALETLDDETPPETATPAFDPAGGSFDDLVRVAISSATPGVLVRFTLDGSEPGPDARIYSTPLFFTQTTTLRARAFADGMPTGDIATATYTKTAPASIALLAWDFTAAGGHAATDGNIAEVASTTNAEGMAAALLTRSVKSPARELGSATGRGAFNTRSNDWDGADLAAAKASGAYLEFVVAPTSGKQVSITALTVAMYRQYTPAGGFFGVEFSFDAFATAGTFLGTVGPAPSARAGEIFTLDTSAQPELQSATGSITFRLYPYGFADYEDKGLGQIAGNNTDLGVTGFLTDPPTAFETWRDDFDWQGADPTPLADPDGDGIPNFLEFAFGDHPLEAESGSPIVSEFAGDYLAISFFHARADLSYLVEGSSDLVEWSLIPHTQTPVGTIQTVTDAEPLSPETPRRFLRVRVVIP